MGFYFNPDNDGFKQALRSQIYVDKTGMIGFINSILNTEQKFAAVSRARRFGKSMATKLLIAYYSKGCDSRELFKGLKAETLPSFESELNKSNVIMIDFQEHFSSAKGNNEPEKVLERMQKKLIQEIHESYPEIVSGEENFLPDVLEKVNKATNEQFIVIIDEWDCLFREAKNNIELQNKYINFLRAMFKGYMADKVIKLAYLTGILPIKKYGTQSALNNFKEYTMVSPDQLTEYVGFTEDEVKALCQRFDMNFEECKRWYDGYSFINIKSVYNPNSVVEAMLRHRYNSYWTKTDTYEVLRDYINMNMDGLKDSIIGMLVGKSVVIEPISFQNDMVTFESSDDVLTLLVHLGYLAYNDATKRVRIPNREIAEEFAVAVKNNKHWGDIAVAIKKSDSLIDSIIEGDADAVAKQLELVHSTQASILTYNNENSLACAINIAFYTAFRFYSIFRELDSGKGFADMVYIPRPGCEYPALLIELKYNSDVDSAMKQIKEKRYKGRLSHYLDNLLMIGINYDKETKKHTCVIEKA